ncbi:hypothetical protein [Neptunicella sp. SCSIO 80796]|uniref:hypothetical protein n=1 Tax=Neptunicella plasticusilytica TaxID=3117012 RepID=UPI003A4D76B7
MRNLLYLGFIALALICQSALSAEMVHLYSSKGYPYSRLIQKTDSVKIFYTENNAEIDCKIEVNWRGDKWLSPARKVTQAEFNQAPLASCLPRSLAKEVLAKTYASS